MAFNWNKPVEWDNEGSAPSDSLKKNGFAAFYKPPAGIFNFFLNRTGKCIKELQTAVDTTDAKVKPISEGGTGATSRVNAFKNLSYLGDEPIKGTANDTVANWVALGSGIAYYSHADLLINQPTAHGTVINLTNGVGDLTQIWQNRPSGYAFVRGGNTGGWFNDGNWSKVATNEDLTAHTGNKNNPHAVTKSQVGLSNVDNTSDTNKPVSTAQATAIADAKKAGTDAQASLTSHTNNKSNPHGVTKAQVGLGKVDNTADAEKSVLNAKLFKSHDMRAEDHFMYVNYNKFTIQTDAVWYLKIKLSRAYSNHSSPIRLEGDYDNLKSVVYLNLEGISNQWSVRVSDYNETNIIGLRVETGKETYIYLKMRAPANGSGNCAIHTDYEIEEMAAYDGTGETFTTLKKGFYTSMPITCLNKVQGLNNVIDATSSDGIAYSATLEGLSSLYNGLTLTIIPKKTSVQKDITFNLNGLGARNIKMIYPTNSGNSGILATSDDWLTAEAPITIRYYQMQNVWKVLDMQRPSAESIDGIGDYIVEQGTSGEWTYRKWASGIAECWGEIAHTITGSYSEGSLITFNKNYPFTFATTPNVFVQFAYAQVRFGDVVNGTDSKSHMQPWITPLVAVDSGLTFSLICDVKGRWK